METKFENYKNQQNQPNIKRWHNPQLIKDNPEWKTDLVVEGTHVKCLPNDIYLKKYWNRIEYATINSDDSYTLHDMSHIASSNKERLLHCGVYGPVFIQDAKPGVHFEWLEHGVVYDSHKNTLRTY